MYEPYGECPKEEDGESAGSEVRANVATERIAYFPRAVGAAGAAGRERCVEEALEARRRRRPAAMGGRRGVKARGGRAERRGV